LEKFAGKSIIFPTMKTKKYAKYYFLINKSLADKLATQKKKQRLFQV